MNCIRLGAAIAALCCPAAFAEVIDFEDAPTPIDWTGPQLFAGYGAATSYAGFTWGGTPAGAYFFRGPFEFNTGYKFGVGTSSQGLVTADDPRTETGSTLAITMRRDSPWTFVGADFTGAFNRDLMVDISGYDAFGNLLHSKTIQLGRPTTPDTRTFVEFVNITELRIQSYGGIDDVDLPPGSIYFGSKLVIDNLVFTPAPAGFAVLGLAGCLPRRRR
jgi:hypothetical protein